METASHHRTVVTPAATSSALGLLLAACALLALRRLVGAFGSPLPPWLLLTTAAILATAFWSVRIVWPRERRANPFVTWSPLAALLLAMVAFSWPMTRTVDWIVWLPIVGGELFFFRPPLVGFANPTNNSTIAAADPPGQLLQQLTRLRDEGGQESLFGTLRAEFAPNERTAVLHVAFCPPLEKTPEIAAEPTDGPDATVRVTQSLQHGARLEVRLARPTEEPTHVVVDFAAHVTENTHI